MTLTLDRPTTLDPLILDEPVDDGTRRELLLGGAVLALGLAGCGADEAASPLEAGSRTVDHLGGSTRIEGRPERIVILDDAMLGYLIPLGVTPVGMARAVGFTPTGAPVYGRFVDYDEIAVVAPDFEPDFERIAAVRPDVIVALQFDEPPDPTLLQIAPTIVVNNDFDVERPGFALFEGNFRTIARAVGREERAEPTLRDYDRRVAELRERYADVIRGTTVSFATFSEDELRIDGPAGFAGSLLAAVGFTFRPEQLAELERQDGWRASFSPERMRVVGADIIINPVGDSAEQREALERNKGRALFDRLTAVREDRFFTVDQELWFSRSVLGAIAVLDDLETRVLRPLQRRGPA